MADHADPRSSSADDIAFRAEEALGHAGPTPQPVAVSVDVADTGRTDTVIDECGAPEEPPVAISEVGDPNADRVFRTAVGERES